MCLLVVAWRAHPAWPLLIAANRDEFHGRPALPLAPWTDSSTIIGGRDLEAGGAWFAVDGQRRTGIVTNFREFGRRQPGAPSRGGLIPAFLSGARSPGEYLRDIEAGAPGFVGFNLLLTDGDSLWYASNRAERFARELPPGIYGLSNELLDTPWPKLVRVKTRFEALLQSANSSDPAALTRDMFELLADRQTAPDPLPSDDLSPEWARKLSAPFVLDPGYGTRCSTVLTINSRGKLHITERRFAADGAASGQSEHSLNVATDADDGL